MRRDELVRLYPNLFHMAEDGAWPSIQEHGLLSSEALLAKWQVAPGLSDAILRDVRTESVAIEHAEFGVAVLRDQKPINRDALESALHDMTVEDWMRTLNARVFFFLQPERLATLVTARSYRAKPHTVLTLDTERLLAGHGDRVELCAINSGFAQPHSKARRGRETFLSIDRYPHPKRSAPRQRPKWDVAELCVRGSVPDIEEFVLRVDRYVDGRPVEQLM